MSIWNEVQPEDLDAILDACVPMERALGAFSGPHEETEETITPICCGTRTELSAGLFGGYAKCHKCGAEVVDMLAPLDSPILQRGNGYIEVAGDALIQRLRAGSWLVVQEGK